MTVIPLCRATVLGLALLAAPAVQAQSTQPRQITVTGEGSIDVTPDMAVVQIGVTEEAEKAADAVAAMNAGMTAVMAELTAAGIDPKDIQTGSLRLDQRYDQSSSDPQPRVVGYSASISVNVRVLALDKVGEIIGAAVSSGANRLEGLSFDVQDRAPLLAEARKAAVADAMARADLYAGAAGVTVGAVQSISEQGWSSQPNPAPMFRMDAAMAVPVAAGQISVQASVTVVYAIGE